MQEIFDFRLTEERAAAVLPPGTGTTFPGGTVRKVLTPGGSEAFKIIGSMHRAAMARGSRFYSSWSVRRRYGRREIETARLFRLIATGFTHEASDPADPPNDGLIALDSRRLLKAKDLVVTLSGEYLVSDRLARLLIEAGASGIELRPVRHKERKGEGSVRLESYPAGRELISRAAAAGYPHSTGSFEPA